MLFKLFTVLIILGNTIVLDAQFLECFAEADCVVKGATCKDNICQCPTGEVFSLDYRKCLPIVTRYQADCEDDNQCSWLLGKHACINGKCGCENGWRYYHGKCLKPVGLNEPCVLNEDCYNGYDIRAMVCTRKNCKCNPDGYYLRGNYDCRPKSNLEEYCSLSSDCAGKAVCNGSRCVNPPDLKSNSLPTINLYDKEDIPKVIANFKLDEPCNSDDECTEPNTYCYPATKKCTCKRGYFFKSSEDGCVAELGTSCKNDKDCKMDYTNCVNGACYCRNSYFSLPSNTDCQKPMTEDNFFCNNKERCYVFGLNAVCNNHECGCKVSYELDNNFVCRYTEDLETCNSCNGDEDCGHTINSKCIKNECECPENYRLEKKVCLPNLGALCSSTIPCDIENSNCVNDICECKEGFVANNTGGCLEMSHGLDTDCLENVQCSAVIQNSECNKNLTCGCMEGYQIYNKTCYPKKYMLDSCTTSTQCNVMLDGNVECKNGICQCPIDMTMTKDNLGCQRSIGFNLKISEVTLIMVLLFSVIKSFTMLY